MNTLVFDNCGRRVRTPMAKSIPISDVDPFADAFLEHPYDEHRALRAAGPVVWLSRYGVWAIARHREVAAALSDHETFCSSNGVGLANFQKEPPWRPPSLLLEADPPDHTRARRVITKVLSLGVVRHLKADFLEQARTMVGKLVSRKNFDGVTELSEIFPIAVFPDLIGIRKDGRENLLRYGAIVFNAFGPRNRHFARAMENAAEVSNWINDSCSHAALHPDGLGSQIHQVAAEHGYSEDEASRIVRSFLSAGVDTTVSGIGNALWCLAEHPEQWARLRSDPTKARAAFEEVIRYESPVQTFFRTATRDVNFDDVTIAEGDKVLLFLGAANRDDRQWDNAERFDIGRDGRGHVGFGFGIHSCIGQMLARLEGEVILTAFAEQVSQIRTEGPIVRQLNNTLRSLASLPLAVTAA
nr:cytochrome P450 [Mycobacterium avium]